MEPTPPNYRREFWKSRHHAWLGLLTVGLGFLSAEPLYLLAGVTAYVLGWIYLPDMAFFRRTIDRREEAAKALLSQQQVTEFNRKRDALLNSLSARRRERYHTLAQICRSIEQAGEETTLAGSDSFDPRLRKLDELMWTFLRLLNTEESLQHFVEGERRENLPALIAEEEAEVGRVSQEVETLKQAGNKPLRETKERLLNSRLERLEVLRKRWAKQEQAEANLAVVVSEQERLDHQIKLIRADAVAEKNTESFTARIDATVEHLNETNKWLTEIDQFKDLVGDMPSVPQRIGFLSAAPASAAPPVIRPPIRAKE